MYRPHSNVLKSISILYTAFLFCLSFAAERAHATSSPIDSAVNLNETLVVTPELLLSVERYETKHQHSLLQAHSARSYVCVPLFRVFNLELQQMKLAEDEVLAVSGDHPKLGQWSVAKAVPLRSVNKERTHWFLRLWICASQRFYYRYLTYVVNARGERVLRRWEGQQVARMLQTYEMYRSPGVDIFGQAYPRSVGGGRQLHRGWLQHEYVVELKFVWQQHLQLDRQSELAKYRLHLTALSLMDDVNIEVSRYAYNRSSFRQQPKMGVRYSSGSIVIFRISQALGTAHALRMEIRDNQQDPLGEAYIWPLELRGSRGILQVPVYGSLQPEKVGELIVPYLVVQPMPRAAACNLRVSFQRYWPNNWPTMDVGYRGLGVSYSSGQMKLLENTIESMLAVPASKGDMVLLEVHLTRDYVPVLWHGFGFYTAGPDKRVQDRFDLRYVLIRQLSYVELKASRVFMLQRWTIQEYTHLNVLGGRQSQRLFPKLKEVFEALPKTLGLIVEIKWPQLMESGVMESTQPHNKNVYVDTMIETAARHGCGRALIFASFDADICTMLALKQHAFPVMLMSIGQSSVWDAYMDLRTQSFTDAINFAESAEILGTATHVENFLGNEQMIHLGLDMQQVVFIWGNDLGQDEKLLERFRAEDASGLIYDNIEEVGPGSWKRAPFFEAAQLLELFSAQCVAIGNSTTAPGVKPPKPTIWPKQR
ncbi:glycerophosphocholine phosphodiesterase GPCPD1 [Scaptodrosophila lebanonensis]|uniref:Glycerophosphocholine phosphodiesterase GPCPD1 n=1 Tax=Drosophila lebanonensis TaxID=7225 RepID=A0A6J2UJC6_DROLE|nr:glycerophosphocholine phosphodiesterase GPCPD1 [Scaptodrosophila lebanonensis]